jgi:hypothetical protein
LNGRLGSILADRVFSSLKPLRQLPTCAALLEKPSGNRPPPTKKLDQPPNEKNQKARRPSTNLQSIEAARQFSR